MSLPEAAIVRDNDSHVNKPLRNHFSTEHLQSNLKHRAIRSGFVTTLSQGVQFVLTMGSTMVLARLLLPADFGLVAMVMAFMGFFQMFKDSGLSTATVQQSEISHAQVSNLFWINSGISGLITLIIACSAPAIAWFFREPRLVGITIPLSLTVVLSGLTVQHMALLSRQMRFNEIAIIQIGSMATGIAVGIALAYTNHGYWSLVWSNVATAASSLLLTWIFCRWWPQRPSRNSGIRPMVSFGANLTIGNFIYSFARGTDTLLIGRFCGSTPLGLYSRAGALLRRPLDQLLSPINAVFIPVLSRIQSQPERYRRTFLQIYGALALGGGIFAGLCLALSRPLTLFLLGPNWGEAVPIVAVLSVVAIFSPLAATCGWLFESQGRGRDSLNASCITSVIWICAFAAGLPFGAFGIAAAFSIAGILGQLPVLYMIAGRSGPVSTKDLWAGFFRYLPAWAVVGSATFAMQSFVGNYIPLVQLVISTSVGIVVASVFIWIHRPSRQTVTSLIDAVREIKTSRVTAAL